MKDQDSFIDIESLISKIVEKNFSTYEQERITLLNAILGNIDILMAHTDEWFGKDVPDDYIRVIRSLFYLSSYILEKRHSSLAPAKLEKKQEIDIVRLLKEYSKAAENILNNKFFNIYTPDNTFDEKIFFSEILLKEVFFNIFFSLYPFMGSDSKCNIHIYSQNLNVVVELFFTKLNESFPGASEIKKNLFNYQYGENERIGIGIDMAINSLKRGGASVRISEIPSDGTCHISMIFPSKRFYSAIDEIRVSQPENVRSFSGDILLFMDDNFMKMFMSDILNERGYGIYDFNPCNIISEINNISPKAIIAEYSAVNEEILTALLNSKHKVILLCSEKDFINGIVDENFIFLRKPFSMEDVFEAIER